MKKILSIILLLSILIGIDIICHFVLKIPLLGILLISGVYLLSCVMITFFIIFYKIICFINDTFETWGV